MEALSPISPIDTNGVEAGTEIAEQAVVAKEEEVADQVVDVEEKLDSDL